MNVLRKWYINLNETITRIRFRFARRGGPSVKHNNTILESENEKGTLGKVIRR